MRSSTLIILVFVSCSLIVTGNAARGHVPEQVHIAKGEIASEMTISWATMADIKSPFVNYGTESTNLDGTAEGKSNSLITAGRIEYFHSATLTNLNSSTQYFYRIGSETGDFSRTFDFLSLPRDDDYSWSPRFIMFGDLGFHNGASLREIINETDNNQYDMVIHLGDIGYDLFTLQARVGDQFMRAIEPTASRVPYMVLPGNHEYLPAIGDGGKNYAARFNMPGGDNNMYTFTAGPVRFVAINTEVYFLSEGGSPARAQSQMTWLRKVLLAANNPEERRKRPWIIVIQHRPVYCSSAQFGRCPGGQSWIRQGIRFLNYPGLEDVFYKYGVDLVFSGHNHHYERSFPVYEKKVRISNTDSPYTNPRAPVYIITGAPGNQEIKDRGEEFHREQYPWSAFRDRNIGYSRLKAVNKTHLHFEQRAIYTNSITDEVWFVRQPPKNHKTNFF